MLIYIDESGIHKKDGYSTIVFSYLLLSNKETAEKQLLETEKQLGIKHFHWSNFGSKNGWSVREKFIREIAKIDFTFKISVLKNPIHFAAAFENSFVHLIAERKINKIIIDGKKPKWYGLKLKKVLRDKDISVKKIITANDESFPILRLADALAGLFRSHYDRPTVTTTELVKLFNKKITVQLVDGQIIQ